MSERTRRSSMEGSPKLIWFRAFLYLYHKKIIKQLLDISTWNRKDTFDYYKNFESPFFNITAQVDVSEMYAYCKKENLSFFLTSLHHSTKICNDIENFRYRLEGEKIWIYNKISAGSTVLFEDNTFGFAYFDMVEDLNKFVADGQNTIDQLKKNRHFSPKHDMESLIHYSVIPWVSFTSFQHARPIPVKDSIPKITFGKLFDQGKKKMMPVSVAVHHALMDGWHVGQYFQKIEDFNPRK